MNRQKVERWIEALESGEYAKGRNLLCIVDDTGIKHYCCWGVAYELEGRKSIQSANSDCLIYQCRKDKGRYGDYAMPSDPIVIEDYASNRQNMQKLIDINDNNDTFEPVVAYLREMILILNQE